MLFQLLVLLSTRSHAFIPVSKQAESASPFLINQVHLLCILSIYTSPIPPGILYLSETECEETASWRAAGVSNNDPHYFTINNLCHNLPLPPFLFKLTYTQTNKRTNEICDSNRNLDSNPSTGSSDLPCPRAFKFKKYSPILDFTISYKCKRQSFPLFNVSFLWICWRLSVCRSSTLSASQFILHFPHIPQRRNLRLSILFNSTIKVSYKHRSHLSINRKMIRKNTWSSSGTQLQCSFPYPPSSLSPKTLLLYPHLPDGSEVVEIWRLLSSLSVVRSFIHLSIPSNANPNITGLIPHNSPSSSSSHYIRKSRKAKLFPINLLPTSMLLIQLLTQSSISRFYTPSSLSHS